MSPEETGEGNVPPEKEKAGEETGPEGKEQGGETSGEETPEEAPPSILIGASGFSYDDWIGPVYPEGTAKGDMLGYYSGPLGFRLVELNFSYYTMPSVKTVEGLLNKTPDDFLFVIKLHQDLTHKIRDERGDFIRNEGALEGFLHGIAPLLESGRLVAALAQFPMRFRRNQGAIEHIKWLAGGFGRLPLVVEVRSPEWVSQSFFETLRSLGAAYCVADGPKEAKLPPFTPVATGTIGYFRFHGRNSQWFGVPTNVRYDYRYSENELRTFIDPVKKVAQEARQTLVFFNNHYQGSAIDNANAFKEMVEGI